MRRSTVPLVTATHLQDGSTQTSDGTVRLRVDVYKPIAVALGHDTPAKQAEWHGVGRSTMYRLLAGEEPKSQTVMRIAADCGVPVEAIWERVA